MRAPAILVGEDQPGPLGDGLIGLVVGQRETDPVVVVTHRQATLAGGDPTDLVGVAALRRTRHVVDQSLGPVFGGLRPVGGDQRGHQRLVVVIVRGADADLALETRIRELLVATERRLVILLLVVVDDPHPLAEPEPEVFRIAQGRRDALGEHFRVHRRKQPRRLGALEPGGVHGHEDVRRARRPLATDPLDELIGITLEHIHFNAGLPLERLIERFIRVVMPGRVEVEGLGTGDADSRRHADAEHPRGVSDLR